MHITRKIFAAAVGVFAESTAVAALVAGAAVVEPKATDEVLCNPGMGFVHFYYSSRIWAYGAQTEPGDTLDWMPGTTVIYMRLPWSYIEPEEGVYRWDLLDSKTAPWIKAGKKIAFRFSCQDHTLLSIPQWAMDAGIKGKWTHEDQKHEFVPYKQEFDEFWDDPVFLAKVEQFLKAFAARYDGNPDVAFVDLGSLGIYGECHTSKFNKDAKDRPERFRRIAKTHLSLFRRCLPNTYLVVSDDIGNDGAWGDLKRKDPATGELLDDSSIFKYCRELGIGFRDDSILCSKNYWWSDRFARRFAKETPVVVETGHMSRRLDNGVWNPAKLKECIEAYHASYFSTHSFPDLYWEVNKGVWTETANRLGYRLELRRVEYPEVVKVNEPVVVKSTWVNVGVALQYGNATLTWNLLNDKGVVCWRVTDNKFGFRSAEPKWNGVEKPVEVATPCRFGYTAPVPKKDVVLDWFVKHKRNLPGEKVELLKPGIYTLAVSVGRKDGKPEIALPLEGGIDRIYPIGKIEVKTPPSATVSADGTDVMSIAGRWRFALGDSTNCTDVIDLPSTTDIARKGNGRINARELEKIDPMRDDAYLTDALTRHPTRRFPYVGPATYERDVDIPAEWAGKRIELLIERTKYVSVYFDGKPIGRCETLATPAVVELPRGTSTGRHRLRLVVDNGLRGRPLSGHQISDDTQTNWNGVMGRMELRAYGEMSIVHVKTFPCAAENRVNVKVVFRNDGAKEANVGVDIGVSVATGETPVVPVKSFPYVAPCGVSTGEFNVVLGPDAPKWSEFNPVLYRLTVKAGEASSTVKFGLRDFKTDGARFILNGRPVFLRGRLDSCVWPLTGAPPMEVEPWRRYFATLKEYGLNHVRFHSWCPPEAAFEAADEAGFYLQPEFASFGGDMGRNVRLRTYCLAESKRILDAYANHPSFVMFTLGNEYCSGLEARKAVVRELRRYDSRPLYAQATNNDYPRPRQCEGDDFWVTFRSYDGPEGNARGSYAHCNAPLGAVQLPGGGTMRDFSSAMRYCTIPIVAHETGQFQAYPDYSEIAKYTGVLKPLNFEVFRARLAKAGLLEYAADFSRASGRLMAINYREEMEEAFRTPGFDGFQLLDIQDYPGQGSALVGILDAFMDSKGFITPEEWRMACAPTVLLARFPRYTYVAGEKFCADVQIVHYGKEDALKGDLAWRIVAEGGTRPVVSRGTLKAEVPLGEVTTIGRIEVELPRMERARKFMLELSLAGGRAKNAYPLWFYPEVGGDVPQGVEVVRDLESAEKALAEGRRALCILDQARAPTNSVPGFFASDFCCWALFNASCARRGGKNVAPGTLGLLVKDKHPALAGFPTSFHSDYQWRELIFQGVNVVLDGNKDADVIVRGIDNVTLNRNLGVIWEKRRGKGRVVYCSLDLEAAKDLPEARALRRSLLDYMSTMK